MRTHPDRALRWIDRGQRRWAMWWGGHFRRLHGMEPSVMALFCDCAGQGDGRQREADALAGLDVLLDLLGREHLHITFNISADLCRTHACHVRRIVDAGHEVAWHGGDSVIDVRTAETGTIDRRRTATDGRRNGPAGAAAMAEAGREAISSFATLGLRPRGYRPPVSGASLAELHALGELGFLWTAQRDAARAPYRLVDHLIRVPVLLDDRALAERRVSPRELMRTWHDRIGRAVRGGRVVAVGVHEWLFDREADYAPELAEHLRWLQRVLELSITSVGALVKIAPTRPVTGSS